MLRCVKAAFQASSTSGQWMSMVLSIQTSPGRNLPLDAPVASTRHTQIALASCFVGITSKYMTAHKTISHRNRKCRLINSDRLRFLPPVPVAHNAARLPKCNKSQSYTVIKVTQCAFQIHHWNSRTCIHFFGSLPVPRAKVAKSTASEFKEFNGISADQQARKHAKQTILFCGITEVSSKTTSLVFLDTF